MWHNKSEYDKYDYAPFPDKDTETQRRQRTCLGSHRRNDSGGTWTHMSDARLELALYQTVCTWWLEVEEPETHRSDARLELILYQMVCTWWLEVSISSDYVIICARWHQNHQNIQTSLKLCYYPRSFNRLLNVRFSPRCIVQWPLTYSRTGSEGDNLQK